MKQWAIFDKWDAFVDRTNEKVNTSIVGKYFQLVERKSNLTTELRAGTVTFLTMAYILAVNAGILKDTGGPCTIDDCTAVPGIPGSAPGTPFCMFAGDPSTGSPFNPGYLACVEEARRSMISATAASALIACFLMGAAANLPIALAPGMGINAYFTYTVVGFFGQGGFGVTYGQALAAAFVEGWIFIFIALTGVRGKIIQLIPKTVMLATAGGIGMFLAFIGMQGSEGIGIITYESATLVTLGGCGPEFRVHQYSIADPSPSSVCAYDPSAPGNVTFNPAGGLGPASPSYSCPTKRMNSGSMWLGIMGGGIMVLLMGRNWRGSIMIGILFVTFISWIPGHSASYLAHSPAYPGDPAYARWLYFKKVVQAPDISKTAVAWSWDAFGNPNLWAALISFLYLDFLDCTGTLFSMATFLNKYLPGFVDTKTKAFPRQLFAFLTDGFAIVVGSLMGIAPLTVYIESATGIKEGGRTGITAIMVCFWFFLSLFFVPVISAIPPYGTGPALMLVGALMMENLLDINWLDVTEAVPAFLTISMIPLTYSIAYGVIAGIGSALFFYIWFLVYDVCAALIERKPLKPIFVEAIPDAFRRDKSPDDDSHSSGEHSGDNGKDVVGPASYIAPTGGSAVEVELPKPPAISAGSNTVAAPGPNQV